MLTSEEIAIYRKYFSTLSDGAIESFIFFKQQEVKDLSDQIAEDRDIIKLLEMILDERMP